MIFTTKAKLIGLVAAAVILGAGQGLWLKSTYNAGFEAGVATEGQKHEKALSDAQKANEKASAELRAALVTYAENYERLRIQRVAGETKVIERLSERLVEHPNCQIDPDVIALRNEVRAP
ncbi:hypothetical protein [Brevundimonas olei]|uniref:hypothetical protein n=1 Tax=Brevundimonas olei TaxID=657642 RepID=UPI0031DAF550